MDTISCIIIIILGVAWFGSAIIIWRNIGKYNRLSQQLDTFDNPLIVKKLKKLKKLEKSNKTVIRKTEVPEEYLLDEDYVNGLKSLNDEFFITIENPAKDSSIDVIPSSSLRKQRSLKYAELYKKRLLGSVNEDMQDLSYGTFYGKTFKNFKEVLSNDDEDHQTIVQKKLLESAKIQQQSSISYRANENNQIEIYNERINDGLSFHQSLIENLSDIARDYGYKKVQKVEISPSPYNYRTNEIRFRYMITLYPSNKVVTLIVKQSGEDLSQETELKREEFVYEEFKKFLKREKAKFEESQILSTSI